MRLCRFKISDERVRVGLFADEFILDLSAQIGSVEELLESECPLEELRRIERSAHGSPRHACSEVTILSPVERQEVWAAGVTYLRSKKARMEESEFSASAYDRV